ncbi:MAG: FecR family protein [Pseudobacter sp.]|uniref:FecR family protein n=1 Tax=Pseudobacter sp. TaxID=2045420 RepID=UPI003F80BD1E
MKHIQKILERYLKGKASSAEKVYVEKHYDYFEQDEDFSNSVPGEEKLTMENMNWKRLESRIYQPTPVRGISIATPYWRWAAASVVLLAAGITWWWLSGEKPAAPSRETTAQADILPGREGAVLTLDDGSQILLDSLQNGVVAKQSGADIVLKNNSISYAGTDHHPKGAVYNTLSTPRGRQFRVELPDGSAVWLNAESSIRYPTAFAGNERRVDITGEVYFDVRKNSNKPFKVTVANTEVIVLGTQFNVNGYTNEASINTTLVEGAVQVNNGNQSARLMPDQQARVSQTSEDIKVSKVNTAQVVTWKNGLFYFDRADVPTAMRQLERWYDIEVIYEGAVPTREIQGELGRDLSLQQVLKVLERMQVKCRLEGRKLIVQQ